jgi:hypothetical protein
MASWEMWTHSRQVHALTSSTTTIPRGPCLPTGRNSPALPQDMRRGARDGGGREPGRPAAGRQPSPALHCLRGGGSELHARSTPPPPDSSSKTAFSRSLPFQKEFSPKTRVQSPRSRHVAQRRQMLSDMLPYSPGFLTSLDHLQSSRPAPRTEHFTRLSPQRRLGV